VTPARSGSHNAHSHAPPLMSAAGQPAAPRCLPQPEPGSSRYLETPLRNAVACGLITGSMRRLADGEHGGDQVIQRPGQITLGHQHTLLTDAKMVDRPPPEPGGRAAGQPGRGRSVPPTGRRCRTRRCQPSGAAWCRPGRSGSRQPSSAQFVPFSRTPAGRWRRWKPAGAPDRSPAFLTAGSVTANAVNPAVSTADFSNPGRACSPGMT
jgi:hypothetical protein